MVQTRCICPPDICVGPSNASDTLRPTAQEQYLEPIVLSVPQRPHGAGEELFGGWFKPARVPLRTHASPRVEVANKERHARGTLGVFRNVYGIEGRWFVL